MVNILPLLCAVTGTQALFLAVIRNPDSLCFAARGETAAQAQDNADNRRGGSDTVGESTCQAVSNRKTGQRGGYWADHGVINYIDGNHHWACRIPSFGQGGSCDAGAGEPRKRDVPFAA